MLLGATGTIGQSVAHTLVTDGYDVTCILRKMGRGSRAQHKPETSKLLLGTKVRFANFSDPASILNDGFCAQKYSVLISCMASRSGAPNDAWAVDFQAHVDALECARLAGVEHMILISALCVQKPKLAFQLAKLKFETFLINSGVPYTIVRPTAFFKSLSGQVERVRNGKPYLLFGDGQRTACKPISTRDLARYVVNCLEDRARLNSVLPIGGPGPPITPLEQGEELFKLANRPSRYRRVPIAVLNSIVNSLEALNRVVPTLDEKIEFARIVRYYATNSMLVINPTTGQYDAEATPSFGSDTLFDHYAKLINTGTSDDHGDHALF